jgi:hypothetical protein
MRRSNPYHHLSLRGAIYATKQSALPSSVTMSSNQCNESIHITICQCEQRSMRRSNLHFLPLSLRAATNATNQSTSPFVIASSDLCDEAICTSFLCHNEQRSMRRSNMHFLPLSLRAATNATNQSTSPFVIASSDLCDEAIHITICHCEERSMRRSNPPLMIMAYIPSCNHKFMMKKSLCKKNTTTSIL